MMGRYFWSLNEAGEVNEADIGKRTCIFWDMNPIVYESYFAIALHKPSITENDQSLQ